MKRTVTVGDTRYRLSKQLLICSGLIRSDEIVLSTFADHDLNETLFHEIFHACEFEMIRRGDLDKESRESYVEGMGVLLYRCLTAHGWLKMDVEINQLELFEFP